MRLAQSLGAPCFVMRSCCLFALACTATPAAKNSARPPVTESAIDTATTPPKGPTDETAHTRDTARVDSKTTADTATRDTATHDTATHDTATRDTGPEPIEICGNGLDDDLDRLPDCDDPDCACTDTCWADAPMAHTNLLAHGSFESLPEPLVGPVPDHTGVWQGDPTERIEAGLPVPFDGSHTLRFVATGAPGFEDARADLFQVLEGTAHRGSRLCLAAAVGRTAGTIDRSFSLTAWAAFGHPEDAPALFEEVVMLDCEVDPRCGHREIAATEDVWSVITTPLHVPAAIGGVTLVVRLSALEDVSDDLSDELGGHLADAVTLFTY